MKFWLFGAGNYGSRYAAHTDRQSIIGFVDNDVTKAGGTVDAIPVYSYKNFLDKFNPDGERIIITCARYDDVHAQLAADKLEKYVQGGGKTESSAITKNSFRVPTIRSWAKTLS